MSLELMIRAQRGESMARNALVALYRPRLVRLVRVRLGIQLSARYELDAASEPVQRAAMSAIGAFRLQSQAGILRWLAFLVERELHAEFEHHRGRGPRASRSSSAIAAPGPRPAGLPDAWPPPGVALHEGEWEELVDRHVYGLTPVDQREVLILRDYLGGDWESVRLELGRTHPQEVQDLHARAHAKLERVLRPWLGDGRA